MPISKHDKQALADLFIHMGVPLVTSIQTVESWSGGEADSQAVRAEKLAKLLNISVDFATKVTKKLEIRDAYTLENVRGKIIRIVTPIIADSYIKNGQTPTDEDIQGLTDLFDVLLSFASSVSPTDEKGSKPTKMATMVGACEPLLTAVREGSFGMNEKEAFNESVSGLKTRAEQLAPQLGLDQAIESGLFQSIVKIYVSCYHSMLDKNSSFQDVWNECDQRLILIQGLTGFVADKAGIQVEQKQEPQTVEAQQKPEVFKEGDKPSKSDNGGQAKTDSNEEKNEDEGDDEGDDFNPMAFFSKG